MTEWANKGHILEEAGYVYRLDRMVYFNPKARKVFSLAFIEDNSESDIRNCIREHTGGTEWRFYFNSQPSDRVRQEIESVLG